MADDGERGGGAGLSLTVTVSSQQAFVPTLEALAARIGEYVGCSADEAKRLAQAVGRALSDASRRFGSDHASGRFDIVFHGNGRLLRVDLSCTSPLPAGVTLEDALGGEDAVSLLRKLVDRVEFGEAPRGPFCRLTRQIRDAR
jgi:hypothetical protein